MEILQKEGKFKAKLLAARRWRKVQPRGLHCLPQVRKSYDPACLVKSPKLNPLNPENTKKLRKKIQNPPPRVGLQKYEKNTEKIRKWSFSGHFCIFLVFFAFFWGPTLGGGFSIFCVILSYFRGSGGLTLGSLPGKRDRNASPGCEFLSAFGFACYLSSSPSSLLLPRKDDELVFLRPKVVRLGPLFLSVNSPALILSEISGVPLAKIAQNRLKLARSRLKSAKCLRKIGSKLAKIP